jgi:hypothetical protein
MRAQRGNAEKDFCSIFRPEGPFLKGLGRRRWRDNLCPEGAIRQDTFLPNRPFRASNMPKMPSFSQACDLG